MKLKLLCCSVQFHGKVKTQANFVLETKFGLFQSLENKSLVYSSIQYKLRNHIHVKSKDYEANTTVFHIIFS